MSKLRVNDQGEIDLRSVEELSRDELREWMYTRLHGRDLIVPEDPREGDMPHFLFASLYPELDRAARQDIESITLDFLTDLASSPESKWKGRAGDELLLLIEPILIESPRREDAVDLLLQMAERPSFIDMQSGEPNLHYRVLQRLVALRHRANPDFWRRQFGSGGPLYAPVVLEGLALFDLSSAFHWLSGVNWNENIEDAIVSLLPSFLEEYGVGKVLSRIEEVLPVLPDAAATALVDFCEMEGLSLVHNGKAGSVVPSSVLTGTPSSRSRRARRPAWKGQVGISVFFPAYNDAGTIASMVVLADRTLRNLTEDYEIIVVNDGSRDHTAQVLSELESAYPWLRVIHHPVNLGYGSALRTGFAYAAKEWIFYTDGDAQYDVRELEKLVPLMTDDIDVVNGYKISRSDPLHRIIIGAMYRWMVRLAFGIEIRDVDCDFRLVRRSSYKRVRLSSTSGTICVEMIKSFQDAGLRFAEAPVNHYHRAYGKSQFFNFKRLLKTLRDLSSLWWRLVIMRRTQIVHPSEQASISVSEEARKE